MAPVRKALYLVAVTLSLCAASAQAQVFKCVDGSGKTVYSQSPCPRDARSTTLRSTAPASPAPAARADGKGGPKTAAEMEQEFRKRRQEAEEAQKKAGDKAAEEKDKADNCRQAKTALAGLEATSRQSRVDENGERRYLSDAELEQEKDRTRRAVQSFCN